MTGIDPITIEIIQNYMFRTCQEMKITVERTAYSMVIGEVLDYSCGLYDAQGNLVAEQSGIPIFLANTGYAIRNSIVKTIGFDNLEPGDMIVTNDPYASGSHLPDTTVMSPIFYKNDIIGIVGFRAHLLDIGGRAPGGMYGDTTEIYQEGLCLPPVWLYRRGMPCEDIFRIIEHNTRTPKLNSGDLRALVSACRVGNQRMVELLDKYGKETVLGVFSELMDHGEIASRKSIEEFPDGTYTAEAYQDGTGDDDKPIDGPYKIKVTVTVQGSNMHIDFTGSAPQLKGSFNVPEAATLSSVRAAFKYITTHDQPNNEGNFRPLTVTIPEGCFLNPKPPAAVSCYPSAVTVIQDLVLAAVAPAIPDRVIAGTFGDICCLFFWGTDPETNEVFMNCEPEGGGYGASADADGESALVCLVDGDTYNMPIEVTETKYRILMSRYELIPDSGGPGKFRGGLGYYRDYIVPKGQRVGTTFIFERQNNPSWGLFGGKSGTTNHVIIHPGTPKERRVAKLTGYWFEEGEEFSSRTGGGGGWGDPLGREPERVRKDVLDGFVTIESAKRNYGVVIDPDTLKLDQKGTELLRNKMREKPNMAA